ncbi:MAG: hypothetical protein KAS91_02200 [Candidatus Pacebacteria bacterium]|nr:hypothetical protein [Candidatus Paceibacterota bacterium]
MKTKIVVIVENKISYSLNDFTKGELKGFKKRIKEQIEEKLLLGWTVSKIKIGGE